MSFAPDSRDAYSKARHVPDRFHDAGPHERLEWEDCRRVVRETVERLTNHDARNCLERWLAGLGVEAIAEQLGMAPGRVRGLLQRGRAEVIQRATDRLRVNARDSA